MLPETKQTSRKTRRGKYSGTAKGYFKNRQTMLKIRNQ